MIEQTATNDVVHEQAPCGDTVELLRALREAGRNSRDPVGFHYLEALARRAQSQRGSVQRIIQDKLRLTTLAFMEQDCSVQSLAASVDKTSAKPGLESLRGLVERLSQHSADESTPTGIHVSLQPELKSIQYFRRTWSKLSIDKQVAHAFAQAPKNAGPMNSHAVALRSLAMMRDIAPDYLNRFLGYVDTLARLDQGGTAPRTIQRRSKPQGGGRKNAR